MNTLLVRKDAIEAVKAALHLKYYAWGEADCAVMAGRLIDALGAASGYDRFQPYATEAGARAALKKRGFADTADWMDSLGLPRIPRARSIAGDIWGYPSACGMTALVVYLGGDKVLSFHPGGEIVPRCHVVAVVVPPRTCWSVTPCLRS